LRPDEFGEVQPTPPEMVDRRFGTPDMLAPPAGDDFESTIQEVPLDVLLRSTWTPECPVTVDELRYVTVSHWGFDQKFHTGEILVNARLAEDIVEVFRRLHQARFPIEEMRVIRLEEIDAHPTGDWNDTTSFVCRPAVGSRNWSQHAFGMAVDINPVAVRCARANAVLNGLDDRIHVLEGDLFDPLPGNARFDLVAFNPPFFRGTRRIPPPGRLSAGGAGPPASSSTGLRS